MNVLGVQLAWFACAYGAIIGVPTVGVIACLLVMGVNFALTREHRTFLCLSLLLGFYGFLAESMLACNGIIKYSSPFPVQGLAPLWIVTLWMAFAGLIYPTFGWLINRPIGAAMLGAFMAPWSYYAAARLGALELSEPVLMPLVAIAAMWAVALPIAIHARLILSRFERA